MGAYEAADVVASLRDAFIERGESFITETVFSDPVGEKVGVVARAADRGFDVTLLYIGIDSSDLSRERVRSRVAAGGHNVPSEKLDGHYQRSLDNLERAIEQLPRVVLYDNSSFATPHRSLAEIRHGSCERRGEGKRPAWAKAFLV